MQPKSMGMVGDCARKVETATVLAALVIVSIGGCASDPPRPSTSLPSTIAAQPARSAAVVAPRAGRLAEDDRADESEPPVTPLVIPVADIPDPQPAPDPAELVAVLIEEQNRIRAEDSLGPLKENPQLKAAAEGQARDMAARSKMSHTGSDGSTPKERIERAGYRNRSIAENVAGGQPTALEVLAGWMQSPPHRKNILGAFTEVGAACSSDSEGRLYWCVDFGLPWPEFDPAEATKRVVELQNKERVSAGRRSLRLSPALASAAQEHAREMADQSTMHPRAPDGKTVFEHIDPRGVRFGKISANGSAGLPTPEETVGSWMESPPHKATILGDFSLTGAGYAIAKDGTPYWYVLFAQPARR
jgi:uncharacterized protein YkwD